MKNIKLLLIVAIVTVTYSCQKDDTLTKNLTTDGIEQGKPTGGSTTIKYGKVTDIDGNVYRTIKIGLQTWMVDNLEVTRFRNGDPINQVTDMAQWSALTTGAWCYYENLSSYNEVYGKLYNLNAVQDTRGIAPKGWHVPSHAEWTTLIEFLGGEGVAGNKMKAVSNLWLYDLSPTNSSGFSGLPCGYRVRTGDFVNIGHYGVWWSSTEGSIEGYNGAWFTRLQGDMVAVYRSIAPKESGFSIRCIKN